MSLDPRFLILVVCETFKFDPRLTSNEVDLEENEPSDVIKPGRLLPEVTVKNLYFDIMPLELVTEIVTENEPLATEEVIAAI